MGVWGGGMIRMALGGGAEPDVRADPSEPSAMSINWASQHSPNVYFIFVSYTKHRLEGDEWWRGETELKSFQHPYWCLYMSLMSLLPSNWVAQTTPSPLMLDNHDAHPHFRTNAQTANLQIFLNIFQRQNLLKCFNFSHRNSGGNYDISDASVHVQFELIPTVAYNVNHPSWRHFLYFKTQWVLD